MEKRILKIFSVFVLMFIASQFSAWAGGDTYYYSKMTATAVGGGKVYVNTSTNTSGASYQSESSNTQNSKNEGNQTYYLFYQEDSNLAFEGWFDNSACTGSPKSTDQGYSVSVNAQSTTESSPTEGHYWAKFTQKVNVYSRMTATAVGDGKVFVGSVDAPTGYETTMSSSQQGSGATTQNFTYYLYAQETDNSKFEGWYTNAACTGTPVSTDTRLERTISATSQNSSTPTTETYYAKFSSAYILSVEVRGSQLFPNILIDDTESVNSSSTRVLPGSVVTIQSDEYVRVDGVSLDGSALTASAGVYSFRVSNNHSVVINATWVGGVPPSSWMSYVSDKALICNLSIPGAHQAATKNVSTSAHCQELTLGELFDAGVRVFDLRPETTNTTADNDYSKLKLYHGVQNLSMTFPQALDQLIAKLNGSREFIIIMIRREIEGEGESSAGDRLNSYKSRMKALLNAPKYKDYFVNFRRDLRLGEVRGKILLLSRDDAQDLYADNLNEVVGAYYGAGLLACPMLYGNMRSSLDGGNYFYVQNCYECTQSSNVSNRHSATQCSINDKTEAAKEMLDYMAMYRSADPEQCIWFLNHTSGVSSSGIFSQSNPDVVRNVATVTNKGLLNYIQTNRYGNADSYGPYPLGIIMMDYAGTNTSGRVNTAGKDLCNAIIKNNFNDEMPGFLDGTDDVVYLKNVGTGKYLSMGSNWGTRVVLDDHPYPMLITTDRQDKQMLFRFVGVRNGDGQGHINNFMGLSVEDGENRFYADIRERHNESNWAVTNPIWWNVSNTTGVFTIDRATAKGHNSTWTGANASHTSLGYVNGKLDFGATGANAQWIIVKKSDFYADMEEMEDAENPVDLTGLIRSSRVMRPNANVSYDRTWTHTGWTAMGTPENENNDNIGGIEYWDRTDNSTLFQKIWLPKGTYRLELDGYYRLGNEGDHEAAFLLDPRPASQWPELYADNASTPIASIYDVNFADANDFFGSRRMDENLVTMTIPYNFNQARRGLNKGLYGNTVLFFTVDQDNGKEVEFGIRKNFQVADDWLVINAFRLYGYGNNTVNQRAYVQTTPQYHHLIDNIERYTKWGKTHTELMEAVNKATARLGSINTVAEAAALAGWLDYQAYFASYCKPDRTPYVGTSPVNGGKYYLYNVSRGAWLDGGGRWGTHAVVSGEGFLTTFEQDGDLWFINTHRNNGGTSEYLAHNSFVDCPRNERFRLISSEDGYIIVRGNDNNKALAPRGGTNEVFTDMDRSHHGEALIWLLVTPEERDQRMTEHDNNFDPYHLVDVSYKIEANRFQQRVPLDKWVSTYNNGAVYGRGDDHIDFSWEFFNCDNAELHQTVEGLRPGRYWVTCNGFYRPLDHNGYMAMLEANGGNKAPRKVAAQVNDAELYAYPGEYDANTVGKISPIPEIGTEIGNARPNEGTQTAYGNIPNSTFAAAQFFRDGLYQVDYVSNVEVGADGKLTIGVRKKENTDNDWLVVDNFRLYYANNGNENVTGVEEIDLEDTMLDASEAEYYNLQGQRVTDPKAGIYIRVIGNQVTKVMLK